MHSPRTRQVSASDAPCGRPRAREVSIDDRHAGQRIDNFLLLALKGVPRSRIYRGLRDGEVRVNKGRVRQHYRLRKGDVVRLPPLAGVKPGSSSATASGLPGPGAAATRPRRPATVLLERILYEDADLMVIDKPAGMAVHGGSGVSEGLIESMRALLPEARMLELVHRLDRETSGCLLIAKKRSALTNLHAQLRETGMDKRYVALVKGRWRKQRRVDAALTRNVLKSGERIVRAGPGGKAAVTDMRPLAASGTASIVVARPITGRTHQIRVHALASGHPIAGDERYGEREFNKLARERGLRRLFLHATSIEFTHPAGGATIRVCAELPPELEQVKAAFGLAFTAAAP
ncbi:MAG: RluA family pseudouridine synthase [Gammaproteobacteria bacterium]